MYDAVDRGLAALLIGRSQAIERVRSLIRKVGPSTLPVLIQGPTGSGKELVAQALHLASGRTGSFVAFNVCSIAETIFEDTLFGHVRGAFTGAVGDTDGYLKESDRGTLFLDEISGLPLAAQVKLLRAIESKEFRPIGARKDHRSDFRLISATNDRLDHVVREGRFRSDLLYRLRGIVIELPPLSARLEDVPLLARFFARGQLNQHGAETQLSEGAIDALLQHDWPGNVRELRAVVQCAIALSECASVSRAECLRAASLSGDTRQLVKRRADLVAQRLLEVLEQTGWDVDATAILLGVHRATVYRRLGRLRNASVRSSPAGAAGTLVAGEAAMTSMAGKE